MSNYKYTVWVGGAEVTNYLVTKQTAHDIANYWESQGHDDVEIEVYKNEN